MIRDLGPLTYTLEKKCMCVSHKPISKCSCHFWILFSNYPEFCHFEIMCWLCSATKNHYLGVSCEWADLFWLIISLLVDFYTPLGNEIETKTASFRVAGVGPFLTQVSWSDNILLMSHLDLEYMRRCNISFLMHFGFHFYVELQVFCVWKLEL